jgi:hypothetical protein
MRTVTPPPPVVITPPPAIAQPSEIPDGELVAPDESDTLQIAPEDPVEVQ